MSKITTRSKLLPASTYFAQYDNRNCKHETIIPNNSVKIFILSAY